MNLKYLLIIIVITIITKAFAQPYILDENLNGTSISDCNFTFFDSGGPNKDYYENENYTVTFCAPANQVLEIDFAIFSLGSGDVLNIFDGPSIGSPILASLTGTGPTTTILSSSECVTFQIISDATVVSEGWMINIACVDMACQDFDISGSINDQTTPSITICPGESVELDLTNISFPNNNQTYNQTIGNTDFLLSFGNGTTSNNYPSTSVYNSPGSYYTSIIATDVNDCVEQVNFIVNVECPEVDLTLSCNTHQISNDTILNVCLGDEIDLDISIENNDCYQQNTGNSTINWTEGPNFEADHFYSNDFDPVNTTNTVTVTDEYGCINTLTYHYEKECQLIEVELNSSSHQIINDTIFICPGDTVDFLKIVDYPENDSCYHQADDLGDEIWNFSDGLPPTAPTHIYNSTSNLSSDSVFLPAIYTKIDQYGCLEDDTIIVAAKCQEFEVNISSTSNTIVDGEITDACINTDIELGIDINLLENDQCYHQSTNNMNIEWSTGDIGISETFNYNQPGAYEIEVTVTDQYGCYNKDTVEFNIICQDIQIDIISNTNTITGAQIGTPCLGTPINLEVETNFPQNDECYHQDDNNMDFIWSMGDGTTYNTQSLNHTYIAAGSNNINLTVVDQNGCSQTGYLNATLSCQDFESTITSSSHNINNGILESCINTDIELLATGEYLNNDICYHQSDTNSIFIWDWLNTTNNGNTSTPNFGTIGTFPVNLTLSDTFGCTLEESIQVVIPCQEFNVSIQSSLPIDEGVVYACPGEEISFTAITDFYLNGNCYNQENATTTFNWTIGNNTIQSEQIDYIFTENGLTEITLEAVDLHGCSELSELLVYVYVDPNFIDTEADRDTICYGDTILLSGDVFSSVPFFEPDTIPLPDDSYGVYQSPLTYTVFPPDAILTDVNDIISVCLDIEHSYPGDLEIRLYCPNGQFVELLDYPNLCDDNFLGEPVRSNAFADVAGSPYTYCWSPSSTNGTLSANANLNTYSYTDNVGDSYIDHDHIPAGEYEAIGSFNDLLGCPMHGDWEIYIYDNLAQDNGYLFSWDLNINLSSFLENDTAIFPFEDRHWSSSTEGNIYYSDSIVAHAAPLDTGMIDYTFTVTSKYGCTYDTTLAIYVAPKPVVLVEDDKIICNALNTEISSTITGGTASWISSSPANTNFDDINAPITDVNVNLYQEYTFIYSPNTIDMCKINDSIRVHFYQVTPDFIVTDSINCYGDSLKIEFTGIASDSSHFHWNIEHGSLISENNNEYIFTFPYAGTNQISLNIDDWVCASDTSSYQFTQPIPISILDFSTTDNHCFGYCEGQLSINAQGGVPPYQYHWSLDGETISNSNTASNLCASNNYIAIITDDNGCSLQQTGQIGQPSALNYTTNITIPSCFGYSDGSVSIQNIQGQNPPYSFSWSVPNNYSTSLEGIPTGTYYMYSIDQNNCTDTIEVYVDEPNPVVISTHQDTIVCKNTAFELYTSITGGTGSSQTYNVYWQNNNSAITSPFLVDTLSYLSVYATDQNDCVSNTDYLRIDIYPELQAYFNMDDTICKGDETKIHILPQGGNGHDYTFLVEGNTFSHSPIISYFNASQDINITVDNACESLDTVLNLTVHDLPVINTIADKYYDCAPSEIRFSQLESEEGTRYFYESISDENYYLHSGTQSIYTYTRPGIYKLLVRAESKYSCTDTRIYHNYIHIYDKPEAVFDHYSGNSSVLNPHVYFQNLSTQNFINHWSFGDGESSDEIDPSHTYKTAGQYKVSLIVETEHACVDSTSQYVNIQDHFSLYVPNAFSPDNDGKNERFEIKGHGVKTEGYLIQIFNRWGEPIWESTNLSDSWDGKVNGRYVQNGSYQWLIKCVDHHNTEYTRAGNVTVIR